MISFRSCTPLAVALAAFGCTPTVRLNPLTPSPVRVALRADRLTVAPGDTVYFVASAVNPSHARVRIGEQCGPSIDVLVTMPGGESQSVVAAMLGATGAFECGPGRQSFVAPNDSQVMRLRWVAPANQGEYFARAGLRLHHGLGYMSDPVSVVVR